MLWYSPFFFFFDLGQSPCPQPQLTALVASLPLTFLPLCFCASLEASSFYRHLYLIWDLSPAFLMGRLSSAFSLAGAGCRLSGVE